MELKIREAEAEFNGLLSRISKIFFSELGFINAQKYMRGFID